MTFSFLLPSHSNNNLYDYPQFAETPQWGNEIIAQGDALGK